MKKKIKKILCVTLTLLFLFAIIPDAAFTLEDDPVDEKGLEEIARIQTFLAPLISLAEAIDADLYSEASVQTLQDALATAKTVSTERITQATVGELNQIRKSYNALYSAYYSRLIPKTSFSVHLRYSDNQFARHEVYGNLSIPLCGSGLIETVTVTPGTTLEGLVDQLEIDYSYRQLHAIINGLYVHFSYYNQISNPYIELSKIILHPGDDIVLFTAIPETALGAALGGDSAMLMQYINSLRLQRFEEETATAEAARSFTLHVTETNPVLGKTDGVYTPAEGLTVHVSEPQAEPGGLVTTDPLIVNGEPVKTDENEQAELRLFSEGWVLVQAVNLTEDDKGNYTYYEEGSPITARTYHSMESGAGVWVQITPSMRLDEVKAELLDELRAAYDSYDQTVFPENRLTAFQNAYDEAVAGINGSETTGAVFKAQQKGITLMIRAYNNALNDNAAALSRFRSALSQLPDDASLITEGDRARINALLNAYNAMTAYQISQLLVEELEKYNAIAALEELPAEKQYALTVNIVADTEEATAAVNDMVNWLNTDGRYNTGENLGAPGGGKPVNKLYGRRNEQGQRSKKNPKGLSYLQGEAKTKRKRRRTSVDNGTCLSA